MDLRHPRISRNLALLLLWLFFAQVVLAARETSITLDEPLHITSGYACLLTADCRLVETRWRTVTPPSYALSPMVHLVRSDGASIAADDGLGTGVDQWLPGSLLVPRPSATMPPDTPPSFYALHIGAYTFPELTRLPATVSTSSSGDHVIAGPFEVSAP